jgi:hypothetical protein
MKFTLMIMATMATLLLTTTYVITTIAQSIVLPSAYAEPVVTAGCGPTQQSSLSISISIGGFQPNTFVFYTYTRSDNSVVSGGFSTGPYGQNTIATNVGPHPDKYTIHIYKDLSSNKVVEPVYSSTILIPCPHKHFAIDYYKNNPQIIHYLLGIKSMYNEIKVGDYLINSYQHASNIFNAAGSANPQDQLAAQLLAAKLNIADGGAGSCVNQIAASAEDVLRSQKYGSSNTNTDNLAQISANKDVSYMLFLKDKLEDYNHNGCSSSSSSDTTTLG